MKQIILYFLRSITLSLNAQLKGKIIKVSDGDTVIENTHYKIRLNGDAPKNGQPTDTNQKNIYQALYLTRM